MSKTYEDIEMDFQRALTHAMTDAADDVLAYGFKGYEADAMTMRVLARALCLMAHSIELPWQAFLEAIQKTWETSGETAQKIKEEREQLYTKLKTNLAKQGVDLDKLEQDVEISQPKSSSKQEGKDEEEKGKLVDPDKLMN